MYADKETKAIKTTIAITERRRAIQQKYNQEHNITPTTVIREIALLPMMEQEIDTIKKEVASVEKPQEKLTSDQIRTLIKKFDQEMKQAAKDLRFEDAAYARDLKRHYEAMELAL